MSGLQLCGVDEPALALGELSNSLLKHFHRGGIDGGWRRGEYGGILLGRHLLLGGDSLFGHKLIDDGDQEFAAVDDDAQNGEDGEHTDDHELQA